ncbi:type II secretion system F family protein [Novosphingobium mangrovi (ex Huang et al. 2023)]|uniref:Type II secretion system F family protein n=1 Tax=Novosphingobium mangrovi (ex Huang et al. 2023) TaxID=2976432 RepID=A0ABT2I5H7_9SPHN|nr:type II secretion system F family protein [Novosphingobium mangrovi (ex Huang et al. 2023)]MCT2400067.1 type II secretion system F family protein [Novosphingobium mangrovi (ex Huang et al. 2023)]
MIELIAANATIRFFLLAAIFAGIMFAGVQIANLSSRRATIRNELQRLSNDTARSASQQLFHKKETAWSKLADAIEKAGLSLEDTQGDKLRRKLRAAGYDSPSAPRIFTLARLVMIFLVPLGYILLIYLPGEPMSDLKLYMHVAVMALIGLYFPNLYITAKADRRREQVINGFPDALDLLLVCVEAGLGLESAMDRVAREMVLSHPLVSQVISNATLLMRAGAERESALRQMGENSGVDEIRSFSTLLIQSDKLGTSIAATLRVYAAEMREKRRLRAEEKAHRLPVLISIPLVICMLPTVIGVLMLPGIIHAVRELFPALNGG